MHIICIRSLRRIYERRFINTLLTFNCSYIFFVYQNNIRTFIVLRNYIPTLEVK